MMSATRPEIIPYIFYRDVPAALDWPAHAFGFAEEMRTGTPSGGMHGEMTFHEQRIVMGQGAKEWGMVSPHEAGTATMGVFIYLDDVDAHHARAEQAGAEIVRAPYDDPMAAPIPSATSTATHGSSRRRQPHEHRISSLAAAVI
jgi:PhnB protein